MTEQQQITPFADFIRETARGTTHDKLTAELNDLVRAVTEHGKKGTLTLTIAVAPLSKDADQLKVTAEVKAVAPKAEPRASIYFSDRHGNLSTSDPLQPTLELAELPLQDREVRDI